MYPVLKVLGSHDTGSVPSGGRKWKCRTQLAVKSNRRWRANSSPIQTLVPAPNASILERFSNILITVDPTSDRLDCRNHDTWRIVIQDLLTVSCWGDRLVETVRLHQEISLG